jgi:Calcineurin-like phosphoesterase
MATIAIGDIHGQASALADVLQQIEASITDAETVVFLGDYIDRGPASKQCIDQLLRFRRSTSATVVFLRGNHEDWLLRTMRDPRRHSWLLSMEGLATIQSYSSRAADAVCSAMAEHGLELFAGDVALPYELFFDAMPEEHHAFFEHLSRCWETTDCLCSHAGVDPGVAWAAQHEQSLMWGHVDFPEAYGGDKPLVYGHWNNSVIDDDGRPTPRRVGNTIGIDTIAHGILTAIRLPEGDVLQSKRVDPTG